MKTSERDKWLSEVPDSIRHQAMIYDAQGQVHMIRSNELDEKEWLCVIVANDNPEFWMNTFDSEAEAREFCRVMNWDIID